MVVKNRLDKSFGPVGSFAGIILLIAGIALTYFYLSAAILILIGGFVGFSSTGTIVDYDRKRIKFSNNLFGIIPFGEWIQISPVMKLGIRKSNQTYTAFSQGNRPLDIEKKDFRLILFDVDNKEIMPVKRFDTLDGATAELETIQKELGLGVC